MKYALRVPHVKTGPSHRRRMYRDVVTLGGGGSRRPFSARAQTSEGRGSRVVAPGCTPVDRCGPLPGTCGRSVEVVESYGAEGSKSPLRPEETVGERWFGRS